VAVVQTEVQSGSRLVFPALVIHEFLHVITDTRRFSPPLTMTEALDWMESFLANSSLDVLEPTPESLRQTLHWMREFNLGRKRILDTHLAAILYVAGVRRLCITNQFVSVRSEAANILTEGVGDKFPEQRKQAIPLFVKLLNDSDDDIRLNATNQLKQIDAATTAKTGIKMK
jgi:predicted nucleic acid-binding protein